MPGALLLSVIDLKRKQLRNERIKKKYFRDLSNPMDMNETFFISFYRLNKRAFKMILDDIAPHLSKCSIPPSIQLAAVLRYLAVGSFQGVIANDVNISMGRSTFSKIMWIVMQQLEDRLCTVWIKIPVSQQIQSASKTYFYKKFGMPGVIGCVDGTLIRIVKPPSDHAAYFSRKGYFSLNAMIICDHDMRIVAVDACRPGSCHDSFIWKMSDAKRYFSTMYSEGVRNFWLLGDSGYPLKPYLLTPYKNPAFGTAQHTFNLRHASARNIVERSIGVLKSRFRCLQSTLPYVPSKVVSIINVCCALHNICIHYNIALDEEIIVSSAEDDLEIAEQDEYDNSAVTIRDNIAFSLNLSSQMLNQ